MVRSHFRPWSDGTTGIKLSPLELLGKLAALVPLPRAHLVRYGAIWRRRAGAAGVLESVRQMIVQQFEGCSPTEQGLLEAASVVGVAFTPAAGAAGVESPLEQVEARWARACDHEPAALRGRRGRENDWEVASGGAGWATG